MCPGTILFHENTWRVQRYERGLACYIVAGSRGNLRVSRNERKQTSKQEIKKARKKTKKQKRAQGEKYTKHQVECSYTFGNKQKLFWSLFECQNLDPQTNFKKNTNSDPTWTSWGPFWRPGATKIAPRGGPGGSFFASWPQSGSQTSPGPCQDSLRSQCWSIFADFGPNF